MIKILLKAVFIASGFLLSLATALICLYCRIDRGKRPMTPTRQLNISSKVTHAKTTHISPSASRNTEKRLL